MQVGLLLNHNNKLCYYSEKFKEILEKNNIPFELVDPNSQYLINDIKNYSHLLFRHTLGDSDKFIYETIFHIAHNVYNVKCSPNYESFWPWDDKFKEFYLLKSHNFPVIDSNIFWNSSHALTFLNQAVYPLVVKLPKGASSENVVIVKSNNEARKIINQVFNKGVRSGGLNTKSNLSSFSNLGARKYGKLLLKTQLQRLGLLKYNPDRWQIHKDSILFQKFLPNNPYDIRVTVIGERAFGFRRIVRKDDFRASGSGNIDFDPGNVDKQCVEIALEVSQKMNFTSMAYDFLYDTDKKPYISEICYAFVDWAIHDCPGFWDEKLIWHESKNWPQYYQLMDFLQMEDLKPI